MEEEAVPARAEVRLQQRGEVEEVARTFDLQYHRGPKPSTVLLRRVLKMPHQVMSKRLKKRRTCRQKITQVILPAILLVVGRHQRVVKARPQLPEHDQQSILPGVRTA